MNSSRGMHDVGTHPEHLQFGLIYRSVRLLEIVYIPSNSSCYMYIRCLSCHTTIIMMGCKFVECIMSASLRNYKYYN